MKSKSLRKKKVFESEDDLPDTRLQQQISVAFDTNTGFKEGLEGVTLPAQAVNNIGSYGE
jgi:hypothetical protein